MTNRALHNQFQLPNLPRPTGGPILQRACACGQHAPGGGECVECQKKRLQRAGFGPAPELAPPIVHEVLGGSGQPLDSATQAFMEPRFGRDLSGVRVHSGGRAGESARAVGALAYTVGQQVVFGAGQYAPGTSAGRRLLAHELAHTVQQAGAAASIQTKLEIGAADSAAEHEAERAAHAVLAGMPAPALSTLSRGIQRQGDPAAEAAQAERLCDLPALCRLRFSAPTIVTPARAREAYQRCRPGSFSPADPCLFPDPLAAPAPSATPGSAPGAATGPTAAPGAGSPGSGGGGLRLPDTTLRFSLGPSQFTISLPSSVQARLPISLQGRQQLAIELNAGVSGEFSLQVIVDAIPHVRISLRGAVSTSGGGMASAGLTIESTSTVCRAPAAEASRTSLQAAGERLRDAILAVQNPPPLPDGADPAIAQAERMAAVAGAIYGMYQAIEDARRGCREVPRARLEFGGRYPLSDPGSDRQRAPYVGGTLTIPF